MANLIRLSVGELSGLDVMGKPVVLKDVSIELRCDTIVPDAAVVKEQGVAFRFLFGKSPEFRNSLGKVFNLVGMMMDKVSIIIAKHGI